MFQLFVNKSNFYLQLLTSSFINMIKLSYAKFKDAFNFILILKKLEKN